jgi:LAO/AO transport system kinase
MMTPTCESWRPPVLACSAQTGAGMAEVWEQVTGHRTTLDEHGELAPRRATQQVEWMWAMVRDQLLDRVATDPAVQAELPTLEAEVRDGDLTPTLAAQRILRHLGL